MAMAENGPNPLTRAAYRIASAVEDAERTWRGMAERVEREALSELRSSGVPEAFSDAADGLAAEVAAMRRAAEGSVEAFREAMRPLAELAKAPQWETPSWRSRKDNRKLAKELSAFRTEFRKFLASVARSVRRAYFSRECDDLHGLAKELRGQGRALVDGMRRDAKDVAREVGAASPRFDPGDGVEALAEELRVLGSRVADFAGAWQIRPDAPDVGIEWSLDDETFVRRLADAAETRDGLLMMEGCVGLFGDMMPDLDSLRSKAAKLNGIVQRFEGECRKAKAAKLPRPETPPEVEIARRKLAEVQRSFAAFSAKLQKALERYYETRKRVCGRVAGLSERANALFREMELDVSAGIRRYDVRRHLESVVESDEAMVKAGPPAPR